MTVKAAEPATGVAVSYVVHSTVRNTQAPVTAWRGRSVLAAMRNRAAPHPRAAAGTALAPGAPAAAAADRVIGRPLKPAPPGLALAPPQLETPSMIITLDGTPGMLMARNGYT